MARVLCVDDSQDVGDVLLRMVGREAGLESAGQVTTAGGLVETVHERRADLVLLDLTMPGCDPLAELERLSASGSACKVLVMSGYDDPGTVEAARRAGAAGFVSKAAEPSRLMGAVRRVLEVGGFVRELG